MPKISPASIFRDTSRTAWTPLSAPPKVLLTCSSWIMYIPHFQRKTKRVGSVAASHSSQLQMPPQGGSVAYRKTTGAEAQGIVGIGIIAMSIIRIIIP